jgi:hypothetical protein
MSYALIAIVIRQEWRVWAYPIIRPDVDYNPELPVPISRALILVEDAGLLHKPNIGVSGHSGK